MCRDLFHMEELGGCQGTGQQRGEAVFGVWVLLMRAFVPFSFKEHTCLPSALLPLTACVCPAAGMSTSTPGTKKRSACCIKCATQVSAHGGARCGQVTFSGTAVLRLRGTRGRRFEHQSREAVLPTAEALCPSPCGELVLLECSCSRVVVGHTSKPINIRTVLPCAPCYLILTKTL